MTSETKSEIVIFTGLAAFLAFLWWMNRAQGAGTGIPGLPAITINGAPLFNVAASPDTPINYNPGNTTFDLGAGAPGSCNCPAGAAALQFGSNQNLQAFLASNPDFWTTSLNGLSSWE